MNNFLNPKFNFQAWLYKNCYNYNQRLAQIIKTSKNYRRILQQLNIFIKKYTNLFTFDIWIWAKWFLWIQIIKSVVLQNYPRKLCILGVRFNKILYFNKLFIKLHLPECIVPMKIIQELRRAVKLDLKQFNLELLIMAPIKLLPQKMARDESQEVFYSDMIRRLYRQPLKNERKQAIWIWMNLLCLLRKRKYYSKLVNATIQCHHLKNQSNFMATIIEQQELQKQLREQQEKLKIMHQITRPKMNI